MATKKVKFGGMSTASGMSLFGPTYTADINEKGFVIERKLFRSPITYLPLFDVALIGLYFLLERVNFEGKIEFIVDSLAPQHLMVLKVLALSGALYLTFYFIRRIPDLLAAIRRFRCWHGCEHKVIAAAENNDLGAAWKYSRVNDRCGATFMLSIMAVYLLWIAVVGTPFGVFSMVYLVILAESKYFHKYNAFGILVGRKIQERATTAEPPEYMLRIGENGMEALIEMEAVA
jgi:hypothetical protein